jgi:hypothetical protein
MLIGHQLRMASNCGRQLFQARRREVCRVHAPETTLRESGRKIARLALKPIVIGNREREAHKGFHGETRADKKKGNIRVNRIGIRTETKKIYKGKDKKKF